MDDDLQIIYNYLRLAGDLATAGQPLEEEIPLIANEGFEVVINLAMEDLDYSLEDERGLVTGLGMVYEHLPVIWLDPKQQDLQNFFLLMEKYQGKKKFIHCAANMRASTFMALYRILKEDWEFDEAMQWLREIWEPDEIWNAFINKALGN